MKNILITGGAGFIGYSLFNELQHDKFNITIIDNLNPQVHGSINSAVYKKHGLNFIKGDITNYKLMNKIIKEQNIIIHLAAETGTGQSMYDIQKYCNTNVQGTAILCDLIVNNNSKIEKIIVASSRAIYGEGKYECKNCGIVYPNARTYENIDKNNYNPVCPICKESKLMQFKFTDEKSPTHPSSIYGLTKKTQEDLILMTAKMVNLNAFALRLQNVYGPGQSLINPYTGILSIFTKLAYYNSDISIFEDGEESRDFVFINDVIDAFLLCLHSNLMGQYVINVGSGVSTSVNKLSEMIKSILGSKSRLIVSGTFREGDIRHNCADLSVANNILGYKPKWRIEEGLNKFLNWAIAQPSIRENSSYEKSLEELRIKGLLKKL